MDTPPKDLPHLWIKDMKEEDRISGLYLARAKKMGLTKRGEPFLIITLSDRTGDVEARVWEKAGELASLFKEGDVLEVTGIASSYRKQIQVTLSDLKVSDSPRDPTLFLETSPREVQEMMGSLRDILKDIQNGHLKAVVDSFLSDRDFLPLFKKAPAAKSFHHAYLGGLLEHTLSVCQMMRQVAGHYPELDRDLLIAGGFLHDIGKIREYTFDLQIQYTDEGRLLGHLILGSAMIDEKLKDMKYFPKDLALRLKHLILSHHGEYEFGSPKRPKFLEAFALHLIDDLDAKISGLGRFMEHDRQEGVWTDFNRLFERYFLKGRIPVEGELDHIPGRSENKQRGLFPQKKMD